tara:strand:- start:1538 stop:1798 length:261 start_codon:yes stop_codon:yes gene_type:complete
MSESLQKSFFGVIALGVSCIAIELVPVSRQAAYWNRCFNNTVKWIDEKVNLNGWDQDARDSLAVGVCNGAVYEPKLKSQEIEDSKG